MLDGVGRPPGLAKVGSGCGLLPSSLLEIDRLLPILVLRIDLQSNRTAFRSTHPSSNCLT